MTDSPVQPANMFEAAVRNCSIHPEEAAIANCQRCHRPLCESCAPGRDGKTQCAECTETLRSERLAREEAPAAASVARCAHHPDRDFTLNCDRCGDFLCGECALPSPWDYQTYCGGCIDRLEAEGGGGQIPWEDRSLSLWRRYWRTVKGVLGGPTRFFRAMPTRGVAPAITFQYWSIALAFVPVILFNWALVYSRYGTVPGVVATALKALTISIGIIIVLTPAITLLTSALLHGNLFLVGGRRPFIATYRLSGYLSATGLVYMLFLFSQVLRVPLLGLILGIAFLIYLFGLAMIGAAQTHRISMARAGTAVVLYGIQLYLLKRYVLSPLWAMLL